MTRVARHRGFTLLELIVTMVIFTILLGAVAPVFIHSLRINRRDQCIRDFVAYMKFAQESAVSDSVDYRVYMDDKEGTYWVMRFSERKEDEDRFAPAKEPYAGKRRLPDTVKMERPRARTDRERKARFIAFYPNGACDFASVRFEYDRHGSTSISTKGNFGSFEVKQKGEDRR